MKTLITFFLILVATTGFTQNSWTTQLTDNNSSEYAIKLIKVQDGGYVTVLNRVDTIVNIPQNIEYNKIAIVKLDANGNMVFNKKINIKDSSLIRINDFIELPTGELLLSGRMIEKQSGGLSGSLLIKTDALGDTLWTVYTVGNLGNNSVSVWYNLIDFSTKFWALDAFLTGSSSTLEYFIYEYDYNGNLLNINYQDTMVILTTQPRLFKDINDSVFVVADFKGEGFLPKKMDPFFNKYLLSQTFSSGTGISSDGSILQAFGGGLYKLTGRLDSIWLHPFSEYEFVWGVGTSQYFTKIKPTADGGYVAIGNAINGITDNLFLIKTEALGNKEFGEMYWSVTSNNIDVVQANDGGYVMLNSGEFGGQGIWIVKALQDGTIGIDENNFLKNKVVLYPNPAQNQVTLKFNKTTTAQLAIYNITGKLIITKKLNNAKTHQIAVTALPKGIYIMSITTAENVITKKFIKN